MFIITKHRNRINAIAHFISELGFIDCKDKIIYDFLLKNDYYLTWVNIKPSDNLHIYSNGFIIGKVSFDEPNQITPFHHENNIAPISLHPLLQSVFITIVDHIEVEPTEQIRIFYSHNCISDYQLIIAKTEEFHPSFMGAYLLGSIGYFPGNLTLFEEIKSIPYLKKLYFPDVNLVQHSEFIPQKCNDKFMIERLIEIIPAYKNSALALSGGLESRFLLGLLLMRNLKPKIYSLRNYESEIVEKIIEALELKSIITCHDRFHQYIYTLMSDGMIYYGGGNYHRMINTWTPDEILHIGLWTDHVTCNVMTSAWKKPGLKKSIYSDLIWWGLLSNISNGKINGFRDKIEKEDIFKALEKSLEFGKSYSEFQTRKQWSSWFYHLHRGRNWTFATMSDVSFFIYPVYVFGDKKVSEIGITSTGYSNFKKERLRRINQSLIPNVKVDYSDGRPFRYIPPVLNDFNRIYYEYLKRFFVRFRGLRKSRKDQDYGWFNNLKFETNEQFYTYYKSSVDELTKDSSINLSVQKAGVTLNNVLTFLSKTENIKYSLKKENSHPKDLSFSLYRFLPY